VANALSTPLPFRMKTWGREAICRRLQQLTNCAYRSGSWVSDSSTPLPLMRAIRADWAKKVGHEATGEEDQRDSKSASNEGNPNDEAENQRYES